MPTSFRLAGTSAWQLRTVATAVDGGRLVEDDLPNSYATAFKLASLDDELLDRAKAENVVRPNVTRAEVTSFVRRVIGEKCKSHLGGELENESRELELRLRKLAAEREATLARLAEIKKALNAAAGKLGLSQSLTAGKIVRSRRSTPPVLNGN